MSKKQGWKGHGVKSRGQAVFAGRCTHLDCFCIEQSAQVVPKAKPQPKAAPANRIDSFGIVHLENDSGKFGWLLRNEEYKTLAKIGVTQ